MSDETDVLPDEEAKPTFGERLKTPNGRVIVGIFWIVVVLTIILLLFGYWWPNVSLPVIASDSAETVRETLLVFSLAAAPVMALVWGIAYYSIRHWRHKGDTPPEDGPPIRNNNRVAITWVIVSSILCGFLLIWGLAEMSHESSVSPTAKPVVIDVIGQQWVWNFKYPQNGNITSDELYVPVGKQVVFEVTSTDVIHSFWLPEMGLKIDANPAVTTQANTTPDKIGTYNVRCAELCGLNHAYMETTVHVLSVDDYNKWVRDNGGFTNSSTDSGANNG